MKKILLAVLLLTTALMSETTNMPISQTIITSKIKIIDIRTRSEWTESGIIKGSIPITFFDERGNYNMTEFMAALNKAVKPGEKFAMVCRTGSRSEVVANFLGKNGFDVVNLKGGVMQAKRLGIKLVPYR